MKSPSPCHQSQKKTLAGKVKEKERRAIPPAPAAPVPCGAEGKWLDRRADTPSDAELWLPDPALTWPPANRMQAVPYDCKWK